MHEEVDGPAPMKDKRDTSQNSSKKLGEIKDKNHNIKPFGQHQRKPTQFSIENPNPDDLY